MNTVAITISAGGALMTAALVLAGTAAANPYEYIGNPINQVATSLKAKGYFVQFNGNPSNPIGRCLVTDIHGLSDPNIDSSGQRIGKDKFTTIYIDFDCLG